MMHRVVDAAPLILLAKIDALELLRVGAEKVFAPSEVLLEVEQGADVATDKVRTAHAQWLLECQARAPLPLTREALGAGERALLEQALALENVQVVSDDLAARRAALQLGLTPIGTLGVLLVAKQLGVIEAVAPCLDALKSAGMYLSPTLVQRVLAEAGEQD
jgi:predicted nucleic acid-binding protein